VPLKRIWSDPEFWRRVCSSDEFKLDAEADRTAGAAELARRETSLVAARLLSLRGDVSAAKTLLQETQQGAPPQLLEAVRAELLRVALAMRDWEHGRVLLLESHRQHPQDLAVLRRLAELDLERNDLRGVEKWEQELRAAGQAGDSVAREYHAWLYVPQQTIMLGAGRHWRRSAGSSHGRIGRRRLNDDAARLGRYDVR
jgi:hypothetical protein